MIIQKTLLNTQMTRPQVIISRSSKNPWSFWHKMFSYHSDSLQIANFATYTYSFNTTHWKKAYDFNTVYHPACQNCEMVNGMNALQFAGELAEQYKKFFATENMLPLINQLWMPFIWCDVHAITVQDYQACMAIKSYSLKAKGYL